MKKEPIRINESQLRNIVAESVQRVLREMDEMPDMMDEEETDEGFWNQAKTAGKTFFSKGSGDGSLKDRFGRAKKNWTSQGEFDDMGKLKETLSAMLDRREISPNTTVAQLVGGKYNKGRFGTMTGVMGNRQAQMNGRM